MKGKGTVVGGGGGLGGGRVDLGGNAGKRGWRRVVGGRSVWRRG